MSSSQGSHGAAEANAVVGARDCLTSDSWEDDSAHGERRYDSLEQKLFQRPVITAPTMTIASDFDGPAADGSGYRDRFSGKYSHKILNGIGHNVPQEAPQAFAEAVAEVDSYVG